VNLVPYAGPFLLGFLGSAAVELVTCFHFYQSESPFPARYRKKGFWAVRLLIAAAAGGLVLAYSIKDDPILAINVGASAPAILLTLVEDGKGARPT
jgi:hypothetical protein